MINKFILTLIIGYLVMGAGSEETTILPQRSDTPPLSLELSTVKEHHYSINDVPIEITFENRDKVPIRILNAFDSPNYKRVFFQVVLRDCNGRPVVDFGGGKISLSKSSFQYVTLSKGDKFKTSINLKDYVKQNLNLKPGSYEITVTYFNQYGEDCFTGKLVSDKLKVELAAE